MMNADSLYIYRRKRHFKRTPEPTGKAVVRGKGRSEKNARLQRFVIQKHDATRLHYDFRLEADGVLKSWAVPKGPSTIPSDKRLAIQTEDHPLSYAKFEGVIPEGEYGGGPVIVWDQGRYANLTERDGKIIPLSEGIEKGHIRFWLKGEKLQGAWNLIRFHGEPKHWLMIKEADEGANAQREPVDYLTRSILTGKRIEELLKGATHGSAR